MNIMHAMVILFLLLTLFQYNCFPTEWRCSFLFWRVIFFSFFSRWVPSLSLLVFCLLLRENTLTPFDLQLENFSLLTHIHLDTLLDEIKRFGQDCFIFLRCFIGDCFLQVHLWFFLPIQMFLFAALAWRKVPNSLLTWAWDLIHLVGTPAFFSLFFLRLFVQVCFCSYPPAHLFGFHYWGAVIQFFSSP